MEYIKIILTSSVVAALVAAFVAIFTTQLKISIENITQERAKWRNKIREKALEVHNAIVGNNEVELGKLKVEFSVILNPSDPEDNLIIELIKTPVFGQELKQSDEFSKRIALLLKHDWERAKLESSSIFCQLRFLNRICKWLRLLQESPNREKLNF